MITLQHLSLHFGPRAVLDDIDLSITPRRLTALMGPNGCGKTTLLRCIGGMLRPTQGKALLDGKSVGDYSARSLSQHVAVVRQQVYADFDFTAFESVMMGRNPYLHRWQGESAADIAVVEESMRQTSTWHLRDRRPSQLSGGERQRVMIARALAQETPVLLMDEPVSNLDIAHQIDIMQLLAGLGKTVVIVLHDLNLARHFCHEVMLLGDGHLIYHGPIDEGLTPQRIKEVYGVATHIEGQHLLFDYNIR